MEVEAQKLEIRYVALSAAQLWDRNAKLHDIGALISSIKRHGFRDAPILDGALGAVVAGNGRLEALRQMKENGEIAPRGVFITPEGEWMVPVQVGVDSASREEAESFGLDHNNLTLLGGDLGVEAILRLYDQEGLKDILRDLAEAEELPISLDGADLDALLQAFKELDPKDEVVPGALASKFLVPPFSVLDSRQGYWMERKRAWNELGVKSWRPDNLLGMSDRVRGITPEASKAKRGVQTMDDIGEYEGGNAFAAGTSIFDPVLCELAYRWYCPRPGTVLDPFAGSSVSGIVAALLGVEFIGIDLSNKQVDSAVERWKETQQKLDTGGTPYTEPLWLRGDAMDMKSLLGARYKDGFDFLFSCPPYFDLEKYSDLPNDLSAQGTYEEFLAMYRKVIELSATALKNNRFCFWVISEIRDENGFYRGFVSDTVKEFQRVGMPLYNEATQILAVGSAALRAGRIFGPARKLVRCHQNVLVFVKGSPELATKEIGPMELPEELEAMLKHLAEESEGTED